MPLTPQDESAAWDEYARRLHAQRLVLMQFQKDYGANIIRALFILNGGAAVAVLTLLGSDFTRTGGSASAGVTILLNGARLGLTSFCVGLLATVLASTLGYFNFNALLETEPTASDLLHLKRGEEYRSTSRLARWTILLTFWCAPVVCLFSAFAFLRGGLFIAHAMKQLASLPHH